MQIGDLGCSERCTPAMYKKCLHREELEYMNGKAGMQ